MALEGNRVKDGKKLQRNTIEISIIFFLFEITSYISVDKAKALGCNPSTKNAVLGSKHQ